MVGGPKSLTSRLFDQKLVEASEKGKYQSFALLDLCEGNRWVTGGFPSQKASYAESVSMS